MEQMESNTGMLELMIQPAFAVKDGIIVQVNEGARQYFLEAGMQITDLLLTGDGEYRELNEGCLYLILSVSGVPCGASVRKINGIDIFTLEQDVDQTELQAMALAAQELRMPLSKVMTVADRLFPVTEEAEDPAVKEQIAQINRGLFQILRIVSNMSDAYRYEQEPEACMESRNITAVFEEIFERSAALLQKSSSPLINDEE